MTRRAWGVGLAATCLIGLTGCSDFIFGGHPGDAAILVNFREPVDNAHLGDFCAKYKGVGGVKEADCGAAGASFLFDKKATARQVGKLSLALNRDPRVRSVLVSVLGPSGDEVIRP